MQNTRLVVAIDFHGLSAHEFLVSDVNLVRCFFCMNPVYLGYAYCSINKVHDYLQKKIVLLHVHRILDHLIIPIYW